MNFFVEPAGLNFCRDEFGKKYTGAPLAIWVREAINTFEEEFSGWEDG